FFIKPRAAAVAVLKAGYDKAKPAEKQLEQTPHDPDANLALGRYTCLVRGDWESGLPMLAKGADKDFAVIAAADLETTTWAADLMATAGAWWDLAEKQTDPTDRAKLRERAAYWY